MLRWRHAFVLSVIVGAAIQGCAPFVVPLPLPQRARAGTPISEETLRSITPGTTTKAQVISLLGEPNVIWEDDRVFAYHWLMYRGEILFGIATMGNGAGTSSPWLQGHVVLVQFEQNDVVKRVEQTRRTLIDAYDQYVVKWRESVVQP